MHPEPRSIVAEFQKSRSGKLTLFSLVVVEKRPGYFSRDLYDVDLSKRHGYLFDQSGSGGGGEVSVTGPYFVGGPVALKIKEGPTQVVDQRDRPPWRGAGTRRLRELNRTRRLRSLPKEFALEPGQDLLDWLERNAIQQDAVYCGECRDCNPGNELCDHMWWCNEAGWYAPTDEPCKRCIGGRCRDDFDVLPHVNQFDQGALWFWSQVPELQWGKQR